MADLRPIIYLTTGEVARFHEEILRNAGQQLTPLRDRALLESAVSLPQTAAFYEGADLIAKEGLYMTSIALIDAFLDGNKRTGYVSGMVFLRVNGVTQRDARLNDPAMGVWLEQVVTRALVRRLRAATTRTHDKRWIGARVYRSWAAYADHKAAYPAPGRASGSLTAPSSLYSFQA